jgi:hypothetical protein
MAKVGRLKTPAGQQKEVPNEDLKFQKNEARAIASPFSVSEPAELLYRDFAEAREWSDGPRGRMKRWTELSVYDRHAWRVLKDNILSGGGKLPLEAPAPGTVALTISEDDCYVTVQVSRESLKSPGVKKALQDADQELDRQKAEKKEFEESRKKITIPGIHRHG